MDLLFHLYVVGVFFCIAFSPFKTVVIVFLCQNFAYELCLFFAPNEHVQQKIRFSQKMATTTAALPAFHFQFGTFKFHAAQTYVRYLTFGVFSPVFVVCLAVLLSIRNSNTLPIDWLMFLHAASLPISLFHSYFMSYMRAICSYIERKQQSMWFFHWFFFFIHRWNYNYPI